MKNNYVDVFPNKIIFSQASDFNLLETKITLTNITQKYVIFKVYITNTAIYSANPATNFILPNDSIAIIIKRKGKNTNEQEQQKDKFLIVAVTVDKAISSAEEAKNIMKQIDLRAETNQEIFLEPEFAEESLSTLGRKTMEPVKVRGHEITAGSKIELDQGSTGSNSSIIQQQIEETKKGIAEVKKRTEDIESQIVKLEDNLNINPSLFESKEKALENKDNNKPSISARTRTSTSCSFSFVLFLAILGLTFGASIRFKLLPQHS